MRYGRTCGKKQEDGGTASFIPPVAVVMLGRRRLSINNNHTLCAPFVHSPPPFPPQRLKVGSRPSSTDCATQLLPNTKLDAQGHVQPWRHPVSRNKKQIMRKHVPPRNQGKGLYSECAVSPRHRTWRRRGSETATQYESFDFFGLLCSFRHLYPYPCSSTR